MVDIYNTKVFGILCFMIICTVVHLFTFFTFKERVYSARRKIFYINGKIIEQTKEMQSIELEMSKDSTYSKMKNFLKTSSDFQKINLADVMFYDSDKNKHKNENVVNI